MEYKYLPKVTSVYFYQLTWGNVSTNSLVFLYIFAAYWVRVKLHSAQTHRAAQRVPGWRVVGVHSKENCQVKDVFCRFRKRVGALSLLQKTKFSSLPNSQYFLSGSQ